ncbi:hypothetical protein Q8W25_11700 [Shimia thalassica]|nr:hypothetical protein [Shimia thalassica]MDP2494682.1 hypothetical protein [Shimia thalassica]
MVRLIGLFDVNLIFAAHKSIGDGDSGRAVMPEHQFRNRNSQAE